ncbi:MAG: ABC transporter permease [Anaerolineae bacterium]|nr:ABC transporter permease [Anaerolineae bacterium]
MKKILAIAWKDFRITYRDLTALLVNIAAPVAMTLVMSFAFGGSDTGFSQIPVGIINLDGGMIGDIFINTFESEELAAYLLPEQYTDIETALNALESDKLAAVIVIPDGMSDMLNDPSGDDSAPISNDGLKIELYPNITRPVSVEIIESILDSILIDLNAGFAAGSLGFSQLIQEGLVTTEELSNGLGEAIGEKLEPIFGDGSSQVTLDAVYQEADSDTGFSWLSYMAPSMAILFLSFSMTNSARSILSEREKGTLPRLLISPNHPGVVLVGKMMGTYIIGLAQVFIFLVISRFLLNVHWGGTVQVFVFTVVMVLSVASWGILVASFARNSGEASAVGTAITLVFAALAGNFIPRGNFPEWLKTIGYITPNAWGIEGYLNMINGATFSDMLLPMVVLLGMSILVLMTAGYFFQRQYRN